MRASERVSVCACECEWLRVKVLVINNLAGACIYIFCKISFPTRRRCVSVAGVFIFQRQRWRCAIHCHSFAKTSTNLFELVFIRFIPGLFSEDCRFGGAVFFIIFVPRMCVCVSAWVHARSFTQISVEATRKLREDYLRSCHSRIHYMIFIFYTFTHHHHPRYLHRYNIAFHAAAQYIWRTPKRFMNIFFFFFK